MNPLATHRKAPTNGSQTARPRTSSQLKSISQSREESTKQVQAQLEKEQAVTSLIKKVKLELTQNK